MFRNLEKEKSVSGMPETQHLLVTGHRLVWRVVRVESSLVEVVSVSIERVDMASI